MSDERSSKTKLRWRRAKEVASALNISTRSAWVNLKTLEEHGLIPPIVEGIEEACDIARSLIAEPRNLDFRANANDVKLMLWAFDKIGDLDRIMAAYRKAMMVVNDDGST